MEGTTEDAARLRALSRESIPEEELEIDPADSAEMLRRKLMEKPFYYDMLIVGYRYGDREQKHLLEALESLRKIDPFPSLLVMTPDRFLPAEMMKLQCTGVLNTPLRGGNVREMLSLARERRIRMTAAGPGVPAVCEGEMVLVRPADILYVRKIRNGMCLTAGGRDYVSRVKMDAFAESAGLPFARCRSGCIANLRHVRSYDGQCLRMVDQTRIPVSRRYQEELSRLFQYARP